MDQTRDQCHTLLAMFSKEWRMGDLLGHTSQAERSINTLPKTLHTLVVVEFDGIPESIVSDFLYSLRHIYLSGRY